MPLQELHGRVHRDSRAILAPSSGLFADVSRRKQRLTWAFVVEVLALLANHNLTDALSQMVGGRTEDQWGSAPPRPRQFQRHLLPVQVEQLVAQYEAGDAIDGLAREFGINRTTVIRHLERHGVQRRKVIRKMTDAEVAAAARRYATGLSLVAVATEFGVCDRTLRREFDAAGVKTRPPAGRPRAAS